MRGTPKTVAQLCQQTDKFSKGVAKDTAGARGQKQRIGNKKYSNIEFIQIKLYS